MDRLEKIIVKRVPQETKAKLQIIAKENGYGDLSNFLRSQFKMIAELGKPFEKESPIQIQLNEINRKLGNMNIALNKNNEIYAEDKERLKERLGDDL